MSMRRTQELISAQDVFSLSFSGSQLIQDLLHEFLFPATRQIMSEPSSPEESFAKKLPVNTKYVACFMSWSVALLVFWVAYVCDRVCVYMCVLMLSFSLSCWTPALSAHRGPSYRCTACSKSFTSFTNFFCFYPRIGLQKISVTIF